MKHLNTFSELNEAKKYKIDPILDEIYTLLVRRQGELDKLCKKLGGDNLDPIDPEDPDDKQLLLSMITDNEDDEDGSQYTNAVARIGKKGIEISEEGSNKKPEIVKTTKEAAQAMIDIFKKYL